MREVSYAILISPGEKRAKILSFSILLYFVTTRENLPFTPRGAFRNDDVQTVKRRGNASLLMMMMMMSFAGARFWRMNLVLDTKERGERLCSQGSSFFARKTRVYDFNNKIWREILERHHSRRAVLFRDALHSKPSSRYCFYKE